MNSRRMPLILALAAVFVVFSLSYLVPLTRNSQAAPAPSGDAAFKGKLLVVQTNSLTATAFLLEKAQVQKIGDRSFLVGKGVEVEGGNVGWCKGRTVRVQMEHIVSITEFDHLKDFEKASKTTIIGGGPYAPAAVTPAPVVPSPPYSPPPEVPAPPGKQ